jgi:hypothetical protein
VRAGPYDVSLPAQFSDVPPVKRPLQTHSDAEPDRRKNDARRSVDTWLLAAATSALVAAFSCTPRGGEQAASTEQANTDAPRDGESSASEPSASNQGAADRNAGDQNGVAGASTGTLKLAEGEVVLSVAELLATEFKDASVHTVRGQVLEKRECPPCDPAIACKPCRAIAYVRDANAAARADGLVVQGADNLQPDAQ